MNKCSKNQSKVEEFKDSEYSYNEVYSYNVQGGMYIHLDGNKQWKQTLLLMTRE